jgi:NTE family protein
MRLLSIILVYVVTSISSAGDDLRPKIGLVLSGGGAKGLAHIGVLKLIDSLQIPIDYVAGTSMGGIVGALYSIGYSGAEIEHIVGQTDWDALFSDKLERNRLPFLQKKDIDRYQLRLGLDGFTPVIPSGLISGQKISMMFSRLTYRYSHISSFDQLPIPFRCIAVDLVTGNEVVLDSGSLALAMRATMSIPSIFSPVEWGDSLLIDGGLINNFPVDVVRDMGAEVVIGINVGAPLKTKNELKNILDVFEQTFFLAAESRVEENKAQTELLISPKLLDFTAASFDQDDVIVIMRRGSDAATEIRAHLEEFKNLYNLQRSEVSQTDYVPPVIHSLEIEGNKSLPFAFIYNYLNITPGQKFEVDKLEERLEELYALGYLQTIRYSLEQQKNNRVALTIHVTEKPRQELRIGFHYNDFHQLIAALSVSGTDILIPGLRLENELQFAGVTRVLLQAYLHSRGFNFPLYPFARIYFKDDPINIYDIQGPKIASYKDRSTTLMAGIGLYLGSAVNMTGAYAIEYMNIKPDIALFDEELFPRFKDRLVQLRFEAEIDMLDDILLPRKGYQLQAHYEGSFKDLSSKLNYTRFGLSARFYLTAAESHTFIFSGFYGKTQNELPIYKAFYFGGPDSFAGLDYTQLVADNLSILRSSYRYEYKKDIFFKIFLNAAIDYRIVDIRPPADYVLFGFGMAVKFLSIFGPLELTLARSEFSPFTPGEKQNNIYVTAGYIF